MIRSLLTGAVLMLALTGAACSKPAANGDQATDQAGAGGGGHGGGFQRMDANGDGKVSLDEFVQGRRAQFKRLDTNGDGKLSMDEIQASGRDRMIERLKALDTDHDGFLTPDEYRAGRPSGGVGQGGGDQGGQGGGQSND